MLHLGEQERHRIDAHAEDQRLLKRYVEFASQDAFAEIVSRHLPWVYSICRKSLRDKHMAEDAAQAVFIVLARRAADLPSEVRLSGWLFNTARFVVKDARKQNARRKRREDVAREMFTQRFFATPKAPVDTHTQAALDQALHTLNDRDRAALLMHFYEGMSLGEMADALSISRDGAKKRVARALSRLRERLGKGKKLIPIAALALLLRGQSAQAMPYGFAFDVVNAALIPGAATGAAQALARAAMSLAARATQKLLRALLALEVAAAIALVVYVAMPIRTAPSKPIIAEVTSVPPQSSDRAILARATFAGVPNASTQNDSAEPPYRSGADDPEPIVNLTPSAAISRIESASSKLILASTDSGSAPGSSFAGMSPVTAAKVASFILPAPLERAPLVSTQLPHTPARRKDDRRDTIDVATILSPNGDPDARITPRDQRVDSQSGKPTEKPLPAMDEEADRPAPPLPCVTRLINNAIEERPDLQDEFEQIASNLQRDLFERRGHIKRGQRDGDLPPEWLGEGAEPDRKPRPDRDGKAEKLIRWFKRTGWIDKDTQIETLSPEELLYLLQQLPLASNMDAPDGQWPCVHKNSWKMHRPVDDDAAMLAAPLTYALAPEPGTLLGISGALLLLVRRRSR